MLNPHIFRAYDVRGRVGDDVNPDVFRLVGAAYGTLIRRRGGRTIALGQDNRISSADLKAAFTEGVRSAGLDIVDIGLTPTPLLYFATAHWRLDGGANITGSHNPIEYNGVKMVHAGAAPLTEEEIQSLRTTIEAGDFETGRGSLTERSPRAEYLDAVARLVRPARSLTVVADAGNGVAGLWAPDVLRRHRLRGAGALLRVRRDASPTTCPIPRTPRTCATCRPRWCGLAPTWGWPTTATRTASGVIDERGRRHEADVVLALLARDLLARHPGREDRLRREVLAGPGRRHRRSTAACPSCGRRGTRTSSARCGKTASCWAAR